MICNEPDGYYQLDMNRYLAQKDIVLNQYMKVQSIEAVKRCVINNLGIAVVPRYSVLEEIQQGALVPIETELSNRVYKSEVIYHKNKWVNPQMELALRILQRLFGTKN